MRWLVLTVALSSVARADLFSPGELAKAHSHLEGLSQCTQCHPAGGQLSQATCLTCHGELQPRLKKGQGLHGHIADDKRNCENCHREHQGAAASLIDWGADGEKGFNHQRTGWQLKGAHADAKCTSCHEKRLIVAPTVTKLLEKRPSTRLGLGTSCTDCHFDEHRGQQEQDCEYCHAEKNWKSAPGFNHADTAFPLRGRHLKVKCVDCHEAERDAEAHGFPGPKSETFLRFAPVEHRECLDCHKDPHDNRFGRRCQSCHTVDGWHVLRNVTQERGFHEKTDFPLKGEHIDVECVSCHGPTPGQKAKFKGLPHDTCGTCHMDAHEGQLSAADCATCHTEMGFTPPKYSLQDHAKTRYPLEGAHAAVPCVSCHEPTPALRLKIPKGLLAERKKRKRIELVSIARFDFSKPLERCDSCHKDVHEGQLKEKPCDACHQVSSFLKVKFDHQRDARYALEGAHREVACDKCHFAATPRAAVAYKPLETKCHSCHKDEHAGQFSERGVPSACVTCHQVEGWKKLRFRHEPPFTDFVLDGQHAKAPCKSCHRQVQVAKGVSAVQYRSIPTTCEGCHSDFHRGTFRGFEP